MDPVTAFVTVICAAVAATGALVAKRVLSARQSAAEADGVVVAGAKDAVSALQVALGELRTEQERQSLRIDELEAEKEILRSAIEERDSKITYLLERIAVMDGQSAENLRLRARVTELEREVAELQAELARRQ